MSEEPTIDHAECRAGRHSQYCPTVMARPEPAAPEPLRRLAEEWLNAKPGECYADDVASLIRLLERVVRETAAAVLTAYPCSCAPDYTERGMTAPDCFRCVALEGGVEQALSRWGLE